MKQKVSTPPIEKSKSKFGVLNDIRVSIGILICYWIFLFRELLTGKSWLHDDFPYAYYPGKVLAAVSLSKGILPFWNPYSFGGMPFFADPQIAILYPFNFILMFFVKDDSLSPLVLQISILVHFLIASVSCFFVGRELKFNNFSSLILGLIFTYSSYMIIHAIHMNLLEGVCWLPLIFLMFLKFVKSYKYIYMLAAGIIMSLSILAGYPQTYFFIYVTLGILFLHQIYLRYREKDMGSIKKLGIGLIIYILVSAGISAVQVLPTIEFSQYTERINIGYEFAKQGSLHPLDLFTLIIPKIFGTYNWNQQANELSYWSTAKTGGHQEGGWMYTVSTLYFTLLPLILIVPLLRFVRGKQLFISVKFYFVLIAVVILFAFGGNFFLHKLFFLYVPLFNRFRNPGHVTFIVTFFTSILTGYAINELTREKNALRKYFTNIYFIILGSIAGLIFVLTNAGFFKSFFTLAQNSEINNWIIKQVNISVLLAAGYLSALFFFVKGNMSFKSFSVCLTLILLIDIYLFAYNQNNGTISPQSLYSQNEPLRNKLKEELKSEQFRVNMREGSNMLFQRYQGAVDRIPLLEGYNVLLLQKRYPFNKSDSGSTQSFDLMNIKYKISVDRANNTMSLVENPGYIPKVRMFYDMKVIADDSLTKRYMQSKEFDYRKTLVLDKEPGVIELPKADSSFVADVRITGYDLNRINIEVTTSKNGFLFLSEVYYPEWKAYVDGKETDIYRADYCLRSVYVEKGNHKVEFVYDSDTFRAGLQITIASLILCAAGLTIGVFRKAAKKDVSEFTEKT